MFVVKVFWDSCDGSCKGCLIGRGFVYCYVIRDC